MRAFAWRASLREPAFGTVVARDEDEAHQAVWGELVRLGYEGAMH